MKVLKAIGSSIKNFMILFSFIVNLVLLIVVVVLALLLFDIKNNIATPLVAGLHSSFVGLDEATIDWTIPVRDEVPVRLNVVIDETTIQTNPAFVLNGQTVQQLPGETKVVLTRPVPLSVDASIDLPGLNARGAPATVRLELPAGLELPVSLDMVVGVDQPLPIALDVRAVIPLRETQLHDPVNNLRLLLEPIVRALTNEQLPNNVGEVGPFVEGLISGTPAPNLVGQTEYSEDPWPGFSQAAGYGYELAEENAALNADQVETGIVQQGGIPALDEQIRPEVYAEGGPQAVNAEAQAALTEQGIDPAYADGDYVEDIFVPTQQAAIEAQAASVDPGSAVPADDDMGILTAPAEASP